MSQFEGSDAHADKVKGDAGNPNEITLQLLYNGLWQPLTVNSKQALQAVLQEALKLVGSGPGPILFDESGQELDLNRSASDLGLTSGSKIVLRARAASGG